MQGLVSMCLRLGCGAFIVCGAVGCATTDAVSTDGAPAAGSGISGASAASGGSTSSGGAASAGSGGSATPGSGGAVAANGGATAPGSEGISGGSAGAAKGGTASSSGGTASGSGGIAGGTGGSASGNGGSTINGAAGGSLSKGGATGSGGGTVTNSGGSQTTGTPGTQLFLDDFEDGDYTAPPEMTWIPADTNGMWSVATEDGSKALTVVASSKTLAVSGDISWTDQKLSAKVKVVAGSSAVVSLMGRWAAAKNYVVLEYRVGSASDPEGDLKLRRNAGGSTGDICRYKPPSAILGEWHTIGFSVKGGAGSTPVIYFDGQAVVTETPCMLDASASTAGGIAVGVQSGTLAFDDVTVTVP